MLFVKGNSFTAWAFSASPSNSVSLLVKLTHTSMHTIACTHIHKDKKFTPFCGSTVLSKRVIGQVRYIWNRHTHTILSPIYDIFTKWEMKTEKMNKSLCFGYCKRHQVSFHEPHKLNRQSQVAITVHKTCSFCYMHGKDDGQLITNDLPVTN